MRKHLWNLAVLGLVLCGEVRSQEQTFDRQEKTPFDAPILDVRPRIFIRDHDEFDGLTVAKLRGR